LFIYACGCLAQYVVSTSKSASSDTGDTRRAGYSGRTDGNAGDTGRTSNTGYAGSTPSWSQR